MTWIMQIGIAGARAFATFWKDFAKKFSVAAL
jgi:hypothetical protein